MWARVGWAGRSRLPVTTEHHGSVFVLDGKAGKTIESKMPGNEEEKRGQNHREEHSGGHGEGKAMEAVLN